MNLIHYWEWLQQPDSLIIRGERPVVRGLLNYQGRSFYARLSYGKREFRVLCNSQNGILEVEVTEIGEAVSDDLCEQVQKRLESVANRRNNILCNAL